MRNLKDLQKEVVDNGMQLPTGKYGKEELEVMLRDFYWNRDHKGEKMPEQVEPMLARNIKDSKPEEADFFWNSDQVIAQEKLDGIRNRTEVINGVLRSFSRRKSDKTYLYEENTKPMFWLSELKLSPEWEGAMFDGEVVSTISTVDTRPFTKGGKGTVTQNRLTAVTSLVAIENTREAQEAHGLPLRYVIYDCMRGKGGVDLTQQSYDKRMAVANEFVKYVNEVLNCDKVMYLPWITENKYQWFEQKVREGAEGVMLKVLNKPYEFGKRSKFMLKSKRFIEYDCFVSGWVPPTPGSAWEKEGLVGALQMSAYDVNTGKTHVVASCSNITLEERRRISLHNEDGTFKDITPETYGRIFEVRGQEWSSKIFALKHAVLMRERKGADGKKQEECVIDLEAVKRSIAEAKSGI